MELWDLWLAALRTLIEALGASLGLSAGMAIVAATLLLRVALLPIAVPIAYRGRVRQLKLRALQPELERLRERLAATPELLPERMLALYRQHGLSLVDGRSLAGALAQAPLLLGMFHVLREGIGNGRFLWIANLAKPDALAAIAAGVTTAIAMAFVPDLPEHLRLFMLLAPAVVVALVAFKLASALCVYWTVSNCFTAAQTVLLNRVVERRIRAGRLAA